jgi:hypothetical protein
MLTFLASRDLHWGRPGGWGMPRANKVDEVSSGTEIRSPGTARRTSYRKTPDTPGSPEGALRTPRVRHRRRQGEQPGSRKRHEEPDPRRVRRPRASRYGLTSGHSRDPSSARCRGSTPSAPLRHPNVPREYSSAGRRESRPEESGRWMR